MKLCSSLRSATLTMTLPHRILPPLVPRIALPPLDAAAGSSQARRVLHGCRTVGPENKKTIASKKAIAKRSIVHMALPLLIVTRWTTGEVGERQTISRRPHCEVGPNSEMIERPADETCNILSPAMDALAAGYRLSRTREQSSKAW